MLRRSQPGHRQRTTWLRCASACRRRVRDPRFFFALWEVGVAATTREGPRTFVAVRVAAVLPCMTERLRIALTASDCLHMDHLRTCEAAASAVAQAAEACGGRV